MIRYDGEPQVAATSTANRAAIGGTSLATELVEIPYRAGYPVFEGIRA